MCVYIYKCGGILFSHKQNEMMPFAPGIRSEVRLTEKDKYTIITHKWNLKENDTNELVYKTEIDLCIENKLMATKEESKVGTN